MTGLKKVSSHESLASDLAKQLSLTGSEHSSSSSSSSNLNSQSRVARLDFTECPRTASSNDKCFTQAETTKAPQTSALDKTNQKTTAEKAKALVDVFEKEMLHPAPLEIDGWDTSGKEALTEEIAAKIESGEPIKFVVPAFPFKNANPDKTKSPKADYAEKISLQVFSNWLDKMNETHPTQLTVVRDGSLFSGIMAVDDETITQYGDDVRSMAACLFIDWNSLAEFYPEGDFESKRENLFKEFKQAPMTEPPAGRQDVYHYIRKVMKDDIHLDDANAHKNALRFFDLESAFSKKIKKEFSDCIRLSIHTSPNAFDPSRGELKFGIRMHPDDTERGNMQRTPWQSSALVIKDTSKPIGEQTSVVFATAKDARTLEMIETEDRFIETEDGFRSRPLPWPSQSTIAKKDIPSQISVLQSTIEKHEKQLANEGPELYEKNQTVNGRPFFGGKPKTKTKIKNLFGALPKSLEEGKAWKKALEQLQAAYRVFGDNLKLPVAEA